MLLDAVQSRVAQGVKSVGHFRWRQMLANCPTSIRVSSTVVGGKKPLLRPLQEAFFAKRVTRDLVCKKCDAKARNIEATLRRERVWRWSMKLTRVNQCQPWARSRWEWSIISNFLFPTSTCMQEKDWVLHKECKSSINPSQQCEKQGQCGKVFTGIFVEAWMKRI